MLDNPSQPFSPGPEHQQFTQLDLGEQAPEELATAPDPRQQNKIIAYLEHGDPRVLLHHAVEVTANERHDVMWGLAQGHVSADKIRGLLRHIPTPADNDVAGREIGTHHVFNNLAIDSQLRGILADFSRQDFNQRNSVTPPDVDRFLSLYPDPSIIEPEIELFLARIEAQNDAAKRAEYESKMRTFLQTVYGKRFDYWEQFKLLQQEALGGHGRAPERLSDGEGRVRIQQSMDRAHDALMAARIPGREGNRVRVNLGGGLENAIDYARDQNLATAEVLHRQDLNLGIPEQRQAINALLHSLEAMIQPHDSTSSHRTSAVGVTADVLPYIAGELPQLTPEQASDRVSGSFAVTADRTVAPNGIKEVQVDSGIPGVSIVASGDAIDGRAPESYGGVLLTLKINMHRQS